MFMQTVYTKPNPTAFLVIEYFRDVSNGRVPGAAAPPQPCHRDTGNRVFGRGEALSEFRRCGTRSSRRARWDPLPINLPPIERPLIPRGPPRLLPLRQPPLPLLAPLLTVPSKSSRVLLRARSGPYDPAKGPPPPESVVTATLRHPSPPPSSLPVTAAGQGHTGRQRPGGHRKPCPGARFRRGHPPTRRTPPGWRVAPHAAPHPLAHVGGGILGSVCRG